MDTDFLKKLTERIEGLSDVDGMGMTGEHE